MAVGTASTALVSRAYGAGELGEFRRSCKQSVMVAIGCGILLAVVGFLAAPSTANLFLPNGETEGKRLMIQFLGIYVLGLPAIYIIQSLAGSMRGIGDTKSPMVISGIQILLHILLNFILIFPPRQGPGGIGIPGFNLGLQGSATALSISAWISAIGYLIYSGKTPLGNMLKLTVPMMSYVRRVVRIAFPTAVMAVLRVASLAVFTVVLKFSSDAGNAVAAMRPGFAIESVMFMPSFGLSMAVAALVGQSLGMKRPDRAERIAWLGAHHAALVTGMLSVPIFIFAPQIAELMIVGKPVIAHQATVLLRYLCITEVGFAYAMVMLGAMQGAGDTKTPLWITLFSLWGLRVPMAILLALGAGTTVSFGAVDWKLPFGLGLGAGGAWIAMSATQFVQGILSMILFKRGRWKTQKV